jgi:hypothetical protein
MTPTYLQVQPGDEIRWVNQRSTPVTVEFLGDALDDVTCQRGFDNLIGRQQEMTTIQPNQTVSLCFGNPGTVTYNARMDSPVAGGKMIESGNSRRSMSPGVTTLAQERHGRNTPSSLPPTGACALPTVPFVRAHLPIDLTNHFLLELAGLDRAAGVPCRSRTRGMASCSVCRSRLRAEFRRGRSTASVCPRSGHPHTASASGLRRRRRWCKSSRSGPGPRSL